MATPRAYRTNELDMLDLICWRYYGASSGYVENTLEFLPDNYRLSDYPEVLPAGVTLTLPVIKIATESTMKKLWG